MGFELEMRSIVLVSTAPLSLSFCKMITITRPTIRLKHAKLEILYSILLVGVYVRLGDLKRDAAGDLCRVIYVGTTPRHGVTTQRHGVTTQRC